MENEDYCRGIVPTRGQSLSYCLFTNEKIHKSLRYTDCHEDTYKRRTVQTNDRRKCRKIN